MRKLLAVALLGLAVVAVGCGDDDDDPAIQAPGDTQSESSAGEHNDADVEFAQQMIAHHEQAIDMAELVIAKGESAEVKALAERIKEAQGPEIELMRGWLREWGEDEAPTGGMDMGGMDMGGDDAEMMTDEEMSQLEAAEGGELDRMFLQMMIRHHEGAIAMAESELDEGEFADAKELAQKIIDDQTAEIEEMRSLLDAGIG